MNINLYRIGWKIKLFLFMLGVNFTAFCQFPAGGAPPTGQLPGSTAPPCWDPNCIPVDGGIGFLIAAGAVLGVKKIKEHRNRGRK